MEYMHPMASLTVRLVRSIYEHLRPAIVLFATLCALILAQSSAQAARVLTVGPTTGPDPLLHYTDFQTALIAARPDDTLLLEAGVSFTESYWLPDKTPLYGNYTEWITITTSALNLLPPQGHRITPAYASVLPKIVAPGENQEAIYTERVEMTGEGKPAHHYRFIGVEIKMNALPIAQELVTLVSLGRDSGANTNNIAHHLIFDRCYIHGETNSNLRHAIALNTKDTEIINSYISDVHNFGTGDAQAIVGWNGPGPFKIVNNYLEAAGENILFGGNVPSFNGLIPSNIEIRHNYFFKPLSWKPGETEFVPIPGTPSDTCRCWKVKNILEFKSGKDVVIDNNLFENNWAQSQDGTAILFATGLDSGSWAATENIQFTNNVLRHSGNGINLKGKDYPSGSSPGGYGRNIRIANNLISDIDGSRWGGDGLLFKIGNKVEDLTIDHNTAFQTGNIILTYGDPHPRLILTNNLTSHNQYGIIGDGSATGTATFNAYFYGGSTPPHADQYTYLRNVIIANGPASTPPNGYPTGNCFTTPSVCHPSSLSGVGFVDLAGGNYRLAPTSPFRNKGSEASAQKDIGVNIDSLNVALRTSDFDGDRRTETAVWRPSSGTWYVLGSFDGSQRTYQFGASGDTPAPGDYDGDGQSDYAVFRPGTGAWYILKSSNSISTTSVFFGTNGDQPVPGDYDADGKTDVAVFRSSNNTWYVLKSSNGALLSGVWGQSADRVVPADYDGDGKTDFAVFRPSTTTWYILNSFDSTTRAVQWGLSTDKLVPGDYNGDGRIDIAVWRPSTFTYHIMYSLPATTTLSYQWGASGDLPVIGDFDSDGMTDLCVWRPSNGTWYILQSSTGTLNSKAWGTSGDVLVASAFLP